MSTATAVISGTGLYTPEESISNEELVQSFNAYVDLFNEENKDAIEAGEVAPLEKSSTGFIFKASGIESRYVMNKEGVLDPKRLAPIIPERSNDEQSIQCEISVAAAKQAMERAGKTAQDIDGVIVSCSNLQRPYPAVAIEVQDALGIEGFAYDMNVACSSATFGIQQASDAIKAGSAQAVLVVNPEICSGHLAWQDRDCHFIFGDACTAAVVENKETCTASDAWEILGTKLKTVYSNNIRNNFGFLNRGDESGIGARDKLFVQNGRKVFKEVVPTVAQMISEHLEALSVPVDDVRRFWLHQANLGMNELIAKKVLGRTATREEAPVILDEYANTSSAGSVIAFHNYHKDMQKDAIGVLCSFGAGYSVGSVVMKRM